MQEELVPHPVVERERVEQARLRARDVDGAELSAREGEQRLAVRLDEVGARRPPPPARSCRSSRRPDRSGGGSGGRGAAVSTDARSAEPAQTVRPHEALGLPLRVAEQLAAGAEGGQPRLAGGLRRRASGCLPHAGGHDHRQGREERDASTESHHIGYTPPPLKPSHPEVWRFASPGTTSSEGSSRVTKGAPNELALDHPDRRARAGSAGVFWPRPLLVGLTV